MKISLNWLNEYLKTTLTIDQVSEMLTDLGLEVEGATAYESIKGGLKGIVVGEVLTCEKHPNADRLKITTVTIGGDTPLPIVCGAPNVAKGQKVVVATVGTKLFPYSGDPFTINKSKIRGEVSQGMLCAEDEIGLGDDHDGILVLDQKHEVGTPCSEIFEVVSDTVFEIGLTPNRADAMSHMGVARDLKAACLRHNIPFSWNLTGVSNFTANKNLEHKKVVVKNPTEAPLYYGITIDGVKVAPSPAWLQNRLKAIGVHPINNIVDSTNYILHDLGQPLHAFDADKISGNVVVQTLKKGTKFTTLDGVERTLDEEDLMICDTQKPMCIAGVFGGLDSGISQQTKTVFLESAYFNPISIRKTAKRHGLNTDASFRFERGIDPEIGIFAIKSAALLIQELAGGHLCGEIQEVCQPKSDPKKLILSFDYLYKTLGQEIPLEELKVILNGLEIRIEQATSNGLIVSVPAYRVDVTRPADLVEEILRVYGYNNIQLPKSSKLFLPDFEPKAPHTLYDRIASQLVHKGFYEIKNNSLSNPENNKITPSLSAIPTVELLNPLGVELSQMRTHLIFGVLESIAFNLNRQRKNLKFFEFGNVYQRLQDQYVEKSQIGIAVVGQAFEENWLTNQQEHPFYFLKGVVEDLLRTQGINKYQIETTDIDYFAEAVQVKVGKDTLLHMGIPSQKLLKTYKIEEPIVYAEIFGDLLLKQAFAKEVVCTEIPKFPSSRRDFSLLLDETISFEQIRAIALKQVKKNLKSVNLFDVYQGKNLPKGKKSYAISFVFQDAEKTLTDAYLDKTMLELQKSFEKQLGAELR
ncbi:MAG: phenylalanine--tRNA ligase subunit beta [Flavobacteriaceae bacterium]